MVGGDGLGLGDRGWSPAHSRHPTPVSPRMPMPAFGHGRSTVSVTTAGISQFADFLMRPQFSLLYSRVELERSKITSVQNGLSEQGSYIEAACHIGRA